MTDKRVDNRKRERVDFWLDQNRDDDRELLELIAWFKEQGEFTQTVRDGLRLMYYLKHGDVSMLFELFPLLKPELVANVKPEETPGEKAIKGQLKRIEDILSGQGIHLDQQSTTAIQPMPSTGPKAMNVARVNAPPIEDDEDETVFLEIKKSTSTDSVDNFRRALMGLTN